MRFSVPQFIDVEDKIFGPLTLKQAVYLVGAAGGTYLAYRILGVIGVIFVGIPVVGFALLLGFVQVNNRPFVVTVAAAFFYSIKHRLYLWNKGAPKQQAHPLTTASPSTTKSGAPTPDLTRSKLRALAFSLDTEEGYSTKNE